jgi:triphosphoribosyl-dephospho-CoA synthetase
MSTRDCSSEMSRGRMHKATGFLRAAEDVATLDDTGETNDSVVTLYVHAGIAAADVTCCARLGKHSSGDNHGEAVSLLKTISEAEARHLAVLLGMKIKAGYSYRRATDSDVRKAARAARHLDATAREAFQ